MENTRNGQVNLKIVRLYDGMVLVIPLIIDYYKINGNTYYLKISYNTGTNGERLFENLVTR